MNRSYKVVVVLPAGRTTIKTSARTTRSARSAVRGDLRQQGYDRHEIRVVKARVNRRKHDHPEAV